MRGYPHLRHAVLILVAVQVVILSAPGTIMEGRSEPLGLEPLRHRESVANPSKAKALPKPTLKSPASGISTSDTTATFEWHAVAGANGYRIQVDNNSDFGSMVINDSHVYATSYTPTSGLAPGTYHWQIQTDVVADVSQDSPLFDARQVTVARAAFLPLILKPVVAPRLRAIENPDGDGEYTIRWDAVDGAESYRLWEAKSGALAAATQVYAGSATTYRATGRVLGRCFYGVRAHNDQGASGWSNVEWVDVRWEDEPNNSYQEANGPLQSDIEYRGYPDDRKDYFSLSVKNPGQITVDLTEHTGKGVQLQLFFESTANSVADDRAPPDYHIEWDGPEGTYYVYIYTESDHNRDTAYKLRAVHP